MRYKLDIIDGGRPVQTKITDCRTDYRTDCRNACRNDCRTHYRTRLSNRPPEPTQANRPIRNGERSKPVRPSTASWQRSCPVRLLNLNPGPEQGLATMILGNSGWKSMIKSLSGVLVY